jgi:hypothetical protein
VLHAPQSSQDTSKQTNKQTQPFHQPKRLMGPCAQRSAQHRCVSQQHNERLERENAGLQSLLERETTAAGGAAAASPSADAGWAAVVGCDDIVPGTATGGTHERSTAPPLRRVPMRLQSGLPRTAALRMPAALLPAFAFIAFSAGAAPPAMREACRRHRMRTGLTRPCSADGSRGRRRSPRIGSSRHCCTRPIRARARSPPLRPLTAGLRLCRQNGSRERCPNGFSVRRACRMPTRGGCTSNLAHLTPVTMQETPRPGGAGCASCEPLRAHATARAHALLVPADPSSSSHATSSSSGGPVDRKMPFVSSGPLGLGLPATHREEDDLDDLDAESLALARRLQMLEVSAFACTGPLPPNTSRPPSSHTPALATTPSPTLPTLAPPQHLITG